MTSDKKTFNMKVVRLIETVKIAFGSVSIRGPLLPQTWPARCSQVVNRTVLESSDKTSPNLTRVLDVNPSLFLAREVQPPLIYVGGDGRLNNTNRTNLSITLLCSSTFISPLYLFFSFFASSSCWRAADPRGSRGKRIDLGQPIAAAIPDGVPPGRVGFRVLKSTRRIACVPRFRTGLLRHELRCITLGVGGTRWRVRVRTHFLATPLGTKLWTVSSPFLLRRACHLGFAIYKGNMNTQFTYVDANNTYVG